MLFLNDKDIRKAADIKEALKAIENVFAEYGSNNVLMPPKLYVDLKEYNGDFRAMPAYVKNLEMCSLKWVNVHAQNSKFNLPTVMALIILSDPKNGLPLCIMDGTYPTSLRTGAAGGIAAKYLARRDSKIIGLVGCGVQAESQLQALNEIFKIKEVRYWGHEKSIIKKFAKNLKNTKLNLVNTPTIQECVKNCDIIVTTTPSKKPLIRLEWLKKGVHINAIGADASGKQELSPEILLNAKIVVDAWEQASHSGEINVPLKKGIITKKNIYSDIGKIVAGKKKGRTKESEITIFDSTGLAIQDTAIANMIYKNAVAKKIGKQLKYL